MLPLAELQRLSSTMNGKQPSEKWSSGEKAPERKSHSALRMVVAKWDLLYAEMIRERILLTWPEAVIQVFQLGMLALEAIQNDPPDLFICGAQLDDMDGLEHLEPFVRSSLPVLILTARPERRFFALLRTIRYDGLYDSASEGLSNLSIAVKNVLARQSFVSASLIPFINQPRSITLDELTPKEELVLSVIGDGSDDQNAAASLSLSPFTVNTHRKSIMGKLKLHHKGQLMIYALQNGYIRITTAGLRRPGFQRQAEAGKAERKNT